MRGFRGLACCALVALVAACSGPPRAQAPRISISQVGEPVRGDTWEVSVKDIEERASVGSKFIDEAGSDQRLVAAKYAIKNLSSNPLSAGDAPKLLLIDPLGGEYPADAAKSSSYKAELGLGEEGDGGIAPNATQEGAVVFAVPKDRFDPGTWFLAIGDRGGPRVALTSLRLSSLSPGGVLGGTSYPRLATLRARPHAG